MLYATSRDSLFAEFGITLGVDSRLMLRNILFCFVFYASIARNIFDHTDLFQFLFAVMVTAVFFQWTCLVWMRVSDLHGTTEMLCLEFMALVLEPA